LTKPYFESIVRKEKTGTHIMSTEKKELELDKNGLPDIMQVLPPEYVHRTTFIIPKVQPYTTIATGSS
jgi:hypothetical protein